MVAASRAIPLFPLPSEPRFLEAAAADPRFAVHAVRPTRALVRDAAKFEAASRAACPASSSSSLKRGTEAEAEEQADFSLSMQQSFVQFFLGHLTPYRSLLLFHKPGAGKTCAAISVALDHLRSSAGTGSGRVLLLASGPLQGNFRRQLFDDARFLAGDGVRGTCTRDAYLRVIGKSEDGMTPSEREAALRKVSRLIKAQFAMRGYEEFASELERLSDADVEARFSNKVIIVDEAHNLRPSLGDDKRVSTQVARLAGLGKNNRLLLLTATPMYDAAREIVYLLNLCRANDGGRPPITSDDPAVVGPASVGYVSFALAANPLVFPARMVDGDLAAYPPTAKNKSKYLDFYGDPFPRGGHRFRPGFRVVACPMAREQRAAYDAISTASVSFDSSSAAEEEEGGHGDGDGDRSLLRAVQVANVAFPSSTLAASAGRRGFLACVRGGPWVGGFTYAPSVGPFLSPAQLPRWSCKLARLAESLDEVRAGPVLAFSDYLYAGVLLLAIALEHRGWVRVGGPPLLAPHGGEAEGGGGGGGDRENREKTAKKTMKKRYVLLTGDYRFTPDFAASLAFVNASTDRPDDGVVAALVTRVAGEGVDFRGVREVHVLEPWYNASKLEQVVGRAVRACSHAHLPVEQRNVVVRYYAATFPDRESSDLCMYRLSETKAERIRRLEAVLQANAVDCALFADADRTVDAGLRLEGVDARGAPLVVRPAATGAATTQARCRVPGRSRVFRVGASAGASPPPFPDHLVPQAMRELEAALSAVSGEASTLEAVLAAVGDDPKKKSLKHEVYLDALGRLVSAGRVRFDDGLYALVPSLSAVTRVRHEVERRASPSPLSPDSPVDPAQAFERALDRIAALSLAAKARHEEGERVAYEALRLGRVEAAGAALRFLGVGVGVRVGFKKKRSEGKGRGAVVLPLTALEKQIRGALFANGLLFVKGAKETCWIDWAATPPEAWALASRGSGSVVGLHAVPMPEDHVEGVRSAAAAKVAEWTDKRLTYGYLAAPVTRSGNVRGDDAGSGNGGGAALKLVRFSVSKSGSVNKLRQTGFVCAQTSQFRAQDVVLELAALGSSGSHGSKELNIRQHGRHSKRRLCEALGVALLAAGRLLTPLETVLLGL